MWTTRLCTIAYVANHAHKITEHSREIETSLEFPIGLHYKDLNQNVLLKFDTGSDINCISLGTFHKLFPNKQLNRPTLLLENYGNSPVTIIDRFMAFIRWKEKVFHQEFHVINANS